MAFSAFLFVVSLATTFTAYHVRISAGQDRLATGESLRTNQTLTPEGDTFALGFFDSGDSTHGHRFYLAIWYNNIPGRTVVWVANRNASLTDPAGVATVAANGNLVVVDGNSTVVRSSGIESARGPTSAVIEEGGNLALSEERARKDCMAELRYPIRHHVARNDPPVEVDDGEGEWACAVEEPRRPFSGGLLPLDQTHYGRCSLS